MTTQYRVLLDTDIGSDVDDALALGLLMNSPEVDLVGVTCVYGDVALRARVTHKLMALHGRTGVPVLMGRSEPLARRGEIFWNGDEGEGLLTDEDFTMPLSNEDGIDFIIRTVMASPGTIHLVAIGPLTNIALALQREPRLAFALGGLTIMGGLSHFDDRPDLPTVEHNMRCDPEAAKIVLESDIPFTLVPLDMTTLVKVDAEGVARLRAGGTPYHDILAGLVERYGWYMARGFTCPHDPLAVAALIRPDLFRTEHVSIEVDAGGGLLRGATAMTRQPNAPGRVVVGVDVAAFEAFLIERLAL